MSIEYKCPGCGFSYEIRLGDKQTETCPNCGAPLKAPEGLDETVG